MPLITASVWKDSSVGESTSGQGSDCVDWDRLSPRGESGMLRIFRTVASSELLRRLCLLSAGVGASWGAVVF
jgi:hypothetical protein